MKTVHRLLKIIESVTVASIIALFMVALLGQSASATFPRPPKFSSANSTLVNIVGDSLIFLNKSTGDTIAVLTTNSIRGFGDLNVPDSVLANWALIDSSLSVSGQVITVGGLQTQAGFVLSLGGKSFYYNSDSARFFMTDSLQVSNGFIAPLVRTNDIYSRNGTDVDILVAGTKELTVTSAGVSVPNGYLTTSSYIRTDSTVYHRVVDPDSAYMSKQYIDTHLGGDSVTTSGISDGQILKYSAANSRFEPAADAGASAGTSDSVYINDGSTEYNSINNAIKLKEGTGVDIVRDDSTTYDVFGFNISSAWIAAFIDSTSTNIQRSDTATLADSLLGFDENVQDKVGAMVTGNTETGISVTYQDGDGTLDFAVDLGSTVESNEISDQEIIKDDLDTTTSFTFGSAFKGTAATASNELATIGYVDAQVSTDTTGFMQNSGDTVTGTYRIDGEIQQLGGNNIYLNKDSTALSSFIRWQRPSLTDVALGYSYAFRYFLFSDSLSMGNYNIVNLADPRTSMGDDAATKNYHDTALVAKATYSDSTDAITDGGIDLADIGTNGATNGQIMKFNGSSWALASDLSGAGFWDTLNANHLVWVNPTADTVLQIKFTDGGANPDTVDLYQANGDVLRIGLPTATTIDTIIMGADTIVDLSGNFLVQGTGFTLDLDTSSASLKTWIDANATKAVVTDSTSGDVDTSGTQIAAALDDRIRTDGDTVGGASTIFDFSQSDLMDIDLLMVDSISLTSGEEFYWDAGNTRGTFTDGFSFAGELISGSGGIYAQASNIYTNSNGGGASTNWYGMYTYNGSQTGAYLRHRAASNFWQLSHSLYITDTTDADSMVATHYWTQTEIEDSLNNYIDSARVMDSIQANDNAVLAQIRDTILTGGAITGDLVVNAFKGDSTIADSQYATKNYVDEGQLNNVTIAGGLEITGSFDRWKHSVDFDLSDAWAVHGTKLILQSDSSDESPPLPYDSSFLHPSVIYMPSGFLGYKVWMITTATPGGDDELPYLWVTNSFDSDGHPTNFHEFIDTVGGTFDTLFNPIFKDTAVIGNATDGHLFYSHDKKLWALVRLEIGSGTVGFDSSIIVARYTTDGLNWSAYDTIFTAVEEGADKSFLSPSIILDTNSTYKMFTVLRDTSASELSKVGMYSSLYPDSAWTFVDTTDMRPTNETTRDIWHIDVVPYSSDYFLALIYESVGGTQAQGGLSIAESRDGGLTWSDPKQVLTHTGSGTFADFTLYRSSGYWVEGSPYDKFKLFYSAKKNVSDTTWRIGVTDINFYDSTTFNYNIGVQLAASIGNSTAPKSLVRDSAILWEDTVSSVPTKAWVRDSTVSSGDTKQRTVYIPVDWVSGRDDVDVDDSVHLSLPGMDGATPYLVKDSNTVAVGGGSKNDTIYFWWQALPYDLVSIDSVIFTYRETGSSNIADLWCVTPDHTAGSVMADSVHTNDLIGAAINSATWSRVARYINLSNQNGGDQFALKMRAFIDDTSNVFIGRMFLQCTVEYTY